MDGIEVVFLMWPFPTCEAAPAILDAVTKHAHRIVFLSSGAVRDELEQQAESIGQLHADVEQLIEKSGVEWTFLRPYGLATNTLWFWAPQIRSDGVVRWPFGSSAQALIHERDIAAVAVRALTEGGHAGAKYVLTGPKTLTQVEQVHTIGEVIGRPLSYEEISREAARKMLLTAWGEHSIVDDALDSWARLMTEPGPVTSTVEEVTGTPARTFRDWRSTTPPTSVKRTQT